MKDNFSELSALYAQFRPAYPNELFSFLYKDLTSKNRAWDVGAGTGQVATVLSKSFEEVYATDISAAQLASFPEASNVRKSVQSAEFTDFPDDFFDLITVGQALHWFDTEKFFQEAKRTAKNGSRIAVFGYGLFKSFPAADAIILDFYKNIIGPFWDDERHHIDEAYSNISFPFDGTVSKNFEYDMQVNLDQLLGYLSSWSAVKHYKDKIGKDPIELINPLLEKLWKGSHKITFPIFLKTALISK